MLSKGPFRYTEKTAPFHALKPIISKDLRHNFNETTLNPGASTAQIALCLKSP